MNKAIIVYASGLPSWWTEISRPRIQQYAERIGATFMEVASEWKGVVGRGEAIDAEMEKLPWDAGVLVLDADVIVSREAPDIFELLEAGCFHMALDSQAHDTQSKNRLGDIVALQAINGPIGWTMHYGNAGVVLHQAYMRVGWQGWREYIREMWSDQAGLNYRLRSVFEGKFRILPREWNSFGLNNGFEAGVPVDAEKICKGAYIAHAAGLEPRAEAMMIFDSLMP